MASILVSLDAGVLDDHAEPPRQAQRVQPRDAPGAARARSSRRATTAPLRAVLLTGAGRGFCVGPGPLRAQRRAGRGADRPLGLARLVLQPAGAPHARAAQADRVRGERRRRRRRRQHRARLRHRARRALGELRAVVRAHRPDARTPAAPISCRASSAPRAQWASRCSPSRSAPRTPSAGDSSGRWSTTSVSCPRRPSLRASSLPAPPRAYGLIKKALPASGQQHPRRAARPRARPAARGRLVRGLSQGRRRVHGEAQVKIFPLDNRAKAQDPDRTESRFAGKSQRWITPFKEPAAIWTRIAASG